MCHPTGRSPAPKGRPIAAQGKASLSERRPGSSQSKSGKQTQRFLHTPRSPAAFLRHPAARTLPPTQCLALAQSHRPCASKVVRTSPKPTPFEQSTAQPRQNAPHLDCGRAATAFRRLHSPRTSHHSKSTQPKVGESPDSPLPKPRRAATPAAAYATHGPRTSPKGAT